MTGFRLTLYLAAPVVFNHFTPLDATLCGILFGGRDVQDATLPCLEYRDGVPMASLPFLENWTPLNYVMRPNIDRHLMAGRDIARRLDRKSTTMKNGSDDSKNEVYNTGTTGRFFETPTLVYYFSGNGEEVRRIITEAGAVGGQTSKGYGTLERPSRALLEEIDDKMCGIMHEGRLIRPIPVTMAHDLNIEKEQWVARRDRYSVPYRPEEVLARGLKPSHVATPRRWII